jgi:hypothetical protein
MKQEFLDKGMLYGEPLPALSVIEEEALALHLALKRHV